MDEGLFPHHQPIVVDINKVPREKIIHVPPEAICCLRAERLVEHYGHFCSVGEWANRHDHEGYRCTCGAIICIDARATRQSRA